MVFFGGFLEGKRRMGRKGGGSEGCQRPGERSLFCVRAGVSFAGVTTVHFPLRRSERHHDDAISSVEANDANEVGVQSAREDGGGSLCGGKGGGGEAKREKKARMDWVGPPSHVDVVSEREMGCGDAWIL